MKCSFLFFLSFVPSLVLGKMDDESLSRLSEAMGYIVGKNLKEAGLDLDFATLVAGLQEAWEDKESPLTQEEFSALFEHLQEEARQKRNAAEIVEAENFLHDNALKASVVNVIEGKVQYEIMTYGTGEEVQSYDSPILKVRRRLLHRPFGNSEEMTVMLDEAVEGVRLGVIGMREGEVRNLYIHPELGLEDHEHQALVILEVEVLQANANDQGDSLNEEASY